MKLNDEGQESILQEAHRLTHGDRNAAYGHPYDDYTCTAALISAILGSILTRPITAHEAALIQCCVKLSRESRVPKRDNLVDLAGYAWVARMCHEEHEKRLAPQADPIVLTSAEPPHIVGIACWCGTDHTPEPAPIIGKGGSGPHPLDLITLVTRGPHKVPPTQS